MHTRIATHAAVLELIRRYNYIPKKRLGQNFLTDPRVAEKITAIAGITPDDCVIEIGPGLGGLTQLLSENAAAVLAIELDKYLINILGDIFAGISNVEIFHGDILKTDISALIKNRGWQTAKIAANLPYYITTPVILNLLESNGPLSDITVMVQREVAGRLCAKPGCKEYGALSLAVSYYAEARLAAIVPRNCFFPRPNVDSAIITLKPDSHKRDPIEKEMLFKCIKAAFGQRRKTLLNCLRVQDWINKGRDELLEIIRGCGFDENTRGESLSLEKFILLSRKLED